MTYRLDLAHFFAAFPLIAVFVLWHLILQIYLRPEGFNEKFKRWNVERATRLVLSIGVIVIVADACLFYSAFTLVSWGSAKFSAVGLLAAATYVTILVFVTFVSLYLGDQVTALKKEE